MMLSICQFSENLETHILIPKIKNLIMIISVGCDVMEHQTIKDLDWETDKDVRERIFSMSELGIYDQVKELRFLAGRFAVKEAIVKCLQCGMIDGISLTDIQTLQATNGQPLLQLTGEAKNVADRMNINNWHISITHSSNYTIAFVVAENRT